MVIFPGPIDNRKRVIFPHDLAFRNFLNAMRQTEFARKLDSLGRLVIPAPLRAQLNIETGAVYDFYVEEIGDEIFLCIKCPKADAKIEEAKRILRDAGYTI